MRCFYCVLFSLVWAISAHAVDSRPNILLIMADDMGWTDLGSYGSEIDTPNLDKLAAEGVQFTDFHASLSCSPTRSMLMSGTDNHLAGLGNMGELLTPEQRGQPGYEGYLNDRVASLAEVLQGNGYHTYMAGKWHLGHGKDSIPHARGFDRSFSSLFGGASYWSDMFGMLAVHEEVAEYVIDGQWQEQLPNDFYATRSFADFLMNSIRENRADGKPFLAYLAFTSPHDPMHVPEPWLSRYRGRYDAGYDALKVQRAEAARSLGLIHKSAQVPARFEKLTPWSALNAEQQALSARGMEVYAGMVNNMDYHVGRVVSFLKDIGEYDNTIVLFLSDNGPNPWESEDYPGNAGSEWFAQFDNSIDNIGHPMSHYAYGLGWGAASAGPLSLFKMTVAEGGIRVPLIMAGPGIAGGRHSDAFAYIWDLMPTILDMTNTRHPAVLQESGLEAMRGKSLVHILNGSKAGVYGEDDYVGGEMQNGKWMRRGNMKAVSVAPPYGDGSWQLYDVVTDPGETEDLSGEQQNTMSELVGAWERYAEDVGVVPSN